jgi:hypothetical protein
MAKRKTSVFSTSGDGKSVDFDRFLIEAQRRLQQARQKSRQKSTGKKTCPKSRSKNVNLYQTPIQGLPS